MHKIKCRETSAHVVKHVYYGAGRLNVMDFGILNEWTNDYLFHYMTNWKACDADQNVDFAFKKFVCRRRRLR